MVSGTDNRPIGVFDSGLGGMTVAGEIRRAFPGEAIYYLGDTARIPYGTKSPETIRRYAREIIAFLRKHDVKIVVAACNTVSAAVLPHLAPDDGPPVLGVVEAGVDAVLRPPEGIPDGREVRRVGVIGTSTTIASEAYVRAIERAAPGVEVVQQACPLFVPLIEEGWMDHAVTRAVIAEYLVKMRDAELDALILGCTHYPLIRPALAKFFGPKVRIVDSARAVAAVLAGRFESGMLGAGGYTTSEAELASRYFVTDRCSHFRRLVAAFTGADELPVETLSLEILTAAALVEPPLQT